MIGGWPSVSFRSVPSASVAWSLASDIRNSVAGHSSGWCDLQTICLAGGFRTRWCDFSDDPHSSHSALLVPRTDGFFDVIVDPTPPIHASSPTRTPYASMPTQAHRFRFRVAHEIGHSFFYDRVSRPPRRLLPFSPAEEAFCDEFASALLVPPTDACDYSADTESVFDIHEKFDVSVQAAAYALARAHPDVSIVGLLYYRHFRTQRTGDRVIWSHGPAYIPREARFRSRVVEEARDGQRVAAIETLNVGMLRGKHRVVAQGRRGRKLTVVVVMRP